MSSKKTAVDQGYKPTSDPYKFQNGNSTFTQRPGEGIIIDNNGRQNHYGSNTSNSFLADRLKKK